MALAQFAADKHVPTAEIPGPGTYYPKPIETNKSFVFTSRQTGRQYYSEKLFDKNLQSQTEFYNPQFFIGDPKILEKLATNDESYQEDALVEKALNRKENVTSILFLAKSDDVLKYAEAFRRYSFQKYRNKHALKLQACIPQPLFDDPSIHQFDNVVIVQQSKIDIANEISIKLVCQSVISLKFDGVFAGFDEKETNLDRLFEEIEKTQEGARVRYIGLNSKFAANNTGTNNMAYLDSMKHKSGSSAHAASKTSRLPKINPSPAPNAYSLKFDQSLPSAPAWSFGTAQKSLSPSSKTSRSLRNSFDTPGPGGLNPSIDFSSKSETLPAYSMCNSERYKSIWSSFKEIGPAKYLPDKINFTPSFSFKGKERELDLTGDFKFEQRPKRTRFLSQSFCQENLCAYSPGPNLNLFGMGDAAIGKGPAFSIPKSGTEPKKYPDNFFVYMPNAPAFGKYGPEKIYHPDNYTISKRIKDLSKFSKNKTENSNFPFAATPEDQKKFQLLSKIFEDTRKIMSRIFIVASNEDDLVNYCLYFRKYFKFRFQNDQRRIVLIGLIMKEFSDKEETQVQPPPLPRMNSSETLKNVTIPELPKIQNQLLTDSEKERIYNSCTNRVTDDGIFLFDRITFEEFCMDDPEQQEKQQKDQERAVLMQHASASSLNVTDSMNSNSKVNIALLNKQKDVEKVRIERLTAKQGSVIRNADDFAAGFDMTEENKLLRDLLDQRTKNPAVGRPLKLIKFLGEPLEKPKIMQKAGDKPKDFKNNPDVLYPGVSYNSKYRSEKTGPKWKNDYFTDKKKKFSSTP